MRVCVDVAHQLHAKLNSVPFVPNPMVVMNGVGTVIPNMQRTNTNTQVLLPVAQCHSNMCDSGAINLQNSSEQADETQEDDGSDTIDDPDDLSADFAKELEERIQADQEIETIFSSVPQSRSLSLGKSLPERPGNPIIKDKFFKDEAIDNMSLPNSRMPIMNSRNAYMSNLRDCSFERQKIIFQEDYEAINEMHQLLLSPDNNACAKDVSSRSKTSISEMSSIESDFSRMFIEVNSEDH